MKTTTWKPKSSTRFWLNTIHTWCQQETNNLLEGVEFGSHIDKPSTAFILWFWQIHLSNAVLVTELIFRLIPQKL